MDWWIETFRPIIKMENCEISCDPKVWNIVRFNRADPFGGKPVHNIIVSYLCSLCSNSWQSLQVSVSQVSQKSFSGSCLWMGQKTGRCPDVPTDSRQEKSVLSCWGETLQQQTDRINKNIETATLLNRQCLVGVSRYTVYRVHRIASAIQFCPSVTIATAHQQQHY